MKKKEYRNPDKPRLRFNDIAQGAEPSELAEREKSALDRYAEAHESASSSELSPVEEMRIFAESFGGISSIGGTKNI